ncbi:hypothetical protein JYU11_03320, partial [bacterium AH-315-G05]|nr:hypothetical protein [bacterium AH-315-G05]
MRKTYFLIVIIVVLSMISTACNSEIFQIANQEIDIENQEEIVEVGRNKDTNLILSVTRFKTLNPLLNNNRSLVQVHKLIYESLVSFDEEMKVVPQLAQKWEVSEDGRTIDFTIRQNVYWHDGKEFSIDDIIFTFDVIKKAYKDRKTHSPYEDIADLILSKVDDNTVRFYFERPIGTALDLLVFPILPSHLFLEGNLDKLYSNDFPLVGTGRYKIKEYLRMRQLTLIKNDRYWGKQASIEKIEVVVVPDLNAQISLLDSGEINFVQVVDTDWRRYYDHDSLRVYEFITNNLEFIGFNFKNETLNNLKVRKAIAYAIDRHRLVSNIYLGHATIVDVPVNPNSWLYYEGEYLFSHNIE